MPKMKTNKSAKKRVKLSARGKIKRRSANLGHLLSGKNQKRKRRLKQPKLASKSDEKKLKALLGK